MPQVRAAAVRESWRVAALVTRKSSALRLLRPMVQPPGGTLAAASVPSSSLVFVPALGRVGDGRTPTVRRSPRARSVDMASSASDRHARPTVSGKNLLHSAVADQVARCRPAIAGDDDSLGAASSHHGRAVCDVEVLLGRHGLTNAVRGVDPVPPKQFGQVWTWIIGWRKQRQCHSGKT